MTNWRSPWMDWKPKPSESAVSGVSSSPGVAETECSEQTRKKDDFYGMPRAREENENSNAGSQRTDSTDTAPSVTFYEDPWERWFREGERFWFEDKTTGKRTELIPGNRPENEPPPRLENFLQRKPRIG
jgi:hypothetical protein